VPGAGERDEDGLGEGQKNSRGAIAYFISVMSRFLESLILRYILNQMRNIKIYKISLLSIDSAI